MKAAEVTDELIKRLKSKEADFVRINFANGDMVGHTGNYAATLIAVQTVDICLSRILPVIDELGGMAIITADHGNADEMYEISKKTGRPSLDENGKVKAKTSHTLNRVPCIFYDNTNPSGYKAPADDNYGLSNLASTIVNLLGFESPDFWDKSIIEMTTKF
jgi:2,3-bisphosphoglycerate-independent phosphoglycerate mutase